METLSFRDKFDILLEKRLSGVAGLKYIRLYGKSQVIWNWHYNHKKKEPPASNGEIMFFKSVNGCAKVS